ncbi:MAG: response regulator [Xanthomonadales bacterium]|nr:Regulator of RpoS [Xanthomonadales bacterium]MCC6594546.1 response regulator [Xanthomonadales bacterium]MCE7931824.1 response regulator [Xanthomonadales bacterium PRO6]
METSVTRHISSENPRVMVVDGSKVVRKIIEQLLHQDLPGVTVLSCSTGEEAKTHLSSGVVDLVTTALRLPDMDGMELARYIREHSPQAYIPIVVVSGDVQQRLLDRDLTSDVTDYFDKSLGPQALSTFIRGYIRPEGQVPGEVLYVEDSRVVAVATRRMMEKHGLKVNHVVSVEDAIDILEKAQMEGRIGPDIILTDVYLKGGMTGGDLLEVVRGSRFGYGKGMLPILVMTGDDNAANQTALLRAGANDLVQKPTEERLLITKLGFQLRVSQALRAQSLPTP